VIHGYAITSRLNESEVDLTEVRGIDDRPIEAIESNSAHLLISRHEAHPSPSPESALVHAGVVAQALSWAPSVLPLRFDANFNDVDEMIAIVDQRHEALKAALERVRDRVEIGLRATWQMPPESESSQTSGEGRTYLLAQVARVQSERTSRAKAERVLEEIAAQLDEGVAEFLLIPPRPRLDASIARASLLVEKECAESVLKTLDEIAARETANLAIATVGPLPPYNFVEGVMA
jgi:hypothetical protein